MILRGRAARLGLAAMLAWLPLFYSDAVAPFDLRHIAVCPALSRLLILSLATCLAAAFGVAILAVLATRIAACLRRSSVSDLEALVPSVTIVATAIIVATSAWVQAGAEKISIPMPVTTLIIFASASALATVGLRISSPLPGRIMLRTHVHALALVCTSLWLAAILGQINVAGSIPRLVILVLGAGGLYLEQLRAGGCAGEPGRPSHGVRLVGVLSVGVLAPVLVALSIGVMRASTRVAPPTKAPESALNVLIIMIDTLRADHTTLGGSLLDTTPGLLAATQGHSTYFSRAIAPASSTVPSVKGLFTARSPSSWGLTESNRPPPNTAWQGTRSFRDAGYATAAVSANPLVDPAGFGSDFDYFWSAGGYQFFLRSFVLNTVLAGDRTWDVFRIVEKLGLHKVDGATIRRLATDWLTEGVLAQPFFLYVHFMDPHWPYADRGFFSDDVGPETADFSYVTFLRLNQGHPSNARLRGSTDVTHLVHRYDEEIRHADAMVASLLTEVAKLGLGSRTLTIVVGDHGEEFFEHNGFGHGHDVFEEQVHVPFLVLWPDTPAFATMPSRVDVPVSLLDVMPTLTELLEIGGMPSEVDGRSLAPLLSGLRESTVAPVISEAYSPGRTYLAYREGEWKVRFRFDETTAPWATPHALVFDLSVDPAERAPLDVQDERVSQVIARARAFLRSSHSGTR